MLFSGAVLVAITAWVRVVSPVPPVPGGGRFWFLGLLVPVIGLVQVGMQRMAYATLTCL